MTPKRTGTFRIMADLFGGPGRVYFACAWCGRVHVKDFAKLRGDPTRFPTYQRCPFCKHKSYYEPTIQTGR